MITAEKTQTKPYQNSKWLASSSLNYFTLRMGGYKTSSAEKPSTGVLVTLVFRLIGPLESASSISIAATYDDIQNAVIKEAVFNRDRSFENKNRIVRTSKNRSAGKRYDY
jgi:hypothetical protein